MHAYQETSVLPTFNFLMDKRIDYFYIQNGEIISLIWNLNPDKSSLSNTTFMWQLGGFTPQN